MGMEEFITYINTVGFPIICCIVLFRKNDKLTEAITSLNNTLIEIKTKLEKEG